MKVKILNSRESKVLAKKVNVQFDADFKFEDVVIKTIKYKYYLVSRDLDLIDFDQYHVESYGVLFGSEKGKELQLSMEGAQIVGPKAKKNVVDIGKLTPLWMTGEDIPYKGDAEGIVIIKSGNDYLATGKVKEKPVEVHDEEGNIKKANQKMILNYMHKSRRVKII